MSLCPITLITSAATNLVEHIIRRDTDKTNLSLATAKNYLQQTIATEDRLIREGITEGSRPNRESIVRDNQRQTIELEKRRCEFQFKLAMLQSDSRDKLQEINLEFQAWLEKQKHEHNKEITQYVQEIQLAMNHYVQELQLRINKNNIEFQKWKAQQDRELSLELKNLDGQISLKKAAFDRETQLQLLQKQFENGRNPIWLSTRQFLTNAEIPALRVLLSPLIGGNFPLDQNEVNSKLNKLSEYYSAHQRPVKYFGDIFKGINNAQQATAQVLFADFKCVPMLILDAQLGAEKFYLSHYFWHSNAEDTRNGQFVDGLSLKHQNYIYAKREVLKWQELRAKESQPGKVDRLYGAKNVERLEYNLQILEEEKEALELGLDLDHFEYQVKEKEVKQTANYLLLLHCLNVGLWADIYFLLYAPTKEPLPPLLLEFLNTLDILKDYTKEEIADLMEGLLDCYGKIYQVLANQGFGALVSDLHLAEAEVCYNLKAYELEKRQVHKSLAHWLQQRGITPRGDTKELLQLMKPLIGASDQTYMTRLQQNLDKLKIRSYIDDILPFLNLLQEQEDKTKREEEEKRQREEEKKRRSHEKEPQSLDLGNGVTLELVKIKAGTLRMGGDHDINLKAFLLGKYPVTQRQYLTVMGNNPSNWQDLERPVERVTWHQAVEFCQRLSEKTGLRVMLPSESQWEYAARAGATTAYFFGESDSQLSEYAWYNQNSDGQTQVVGVKKANPWGLFDMLGNVWEWCQDDWIDNIRNLPQDGSSYINNGYTKCLRGGAWLTGPAFCKCDCRTWFDASNYYSFFGLRILVLTGSF